MVIVRNKLAELRAGGPRQFAELRNKFLVRTESIDEQSNVASRLRGLGLDTTTLRNSPVAVVEPSGDIVQTASSIQQQEGLGSRAAGAIDEAADSISEAQELVETGLALESLTIEVLSTIRQVDGVISSSFANTYADYGPENLRMSPFQMPSLTGDEAEDAQNTVGDLYQTLGIYDAHERERGDKAIVAIFDTGYAEDLIDQSRIVETWSGPDVDNVWASEEGHGTMCAGASAANSDEGVPFDGAAPDAGVILVRTTGPEGQIRSDYIAQAWDWIASLDTNRPVVMNHSYGTPICSGRPKNDFCNTPLTDEIRIILEDEDLTAVYAAGNEGMQCGHRPSGLTNAITGTNSIEPVITVGALLTNGREAQRYSSHGRGDCSPIEDPKPNVSCAIPVHTYYGAEGGYTIKNMETGVIGSGGGTSHAAPTTAGMLALVQSRAVKERGEPMSIAELKQLIRQHSKAPHPTQINAFGGLFSRDGWDARFGNGQFDINSALDSIGGS